MKKKSGHNSSLKTNKKKNPTEPILNHSLHAERERKKTIFFPLLKSFNNAHNIDSTIKYNFESI